MKRLCQLCILAFALLCGAMTFLPQTPGTQARPQSKLSAANNDLPPASQDPVARLQQQLDSGAARLDYAEPGGYLQSLLKQLGVPVSSQTLVFSKTSLQARHITPQNPRAIYFNDQVYVGWIRGAELIEVTAVDPALGAAFYTLEQKSVARPRFTSEHRCMGCHGGANTSFVPGHFLRSVLADADGARLEGPSFITDHTSPLGERWGGWYVTGTHGTAEHLGNMIFTSDSVPEQRTGGNLTRLDRLVDLRGYASPHSDIVALMVLAHQTQMQNLLVWLGNETRVALKEQAELDRAAGRQAGEWAASTRFRVEYAVNETLKYLLFAEEAPLDASIAGTSNFAVEFAARGLRDKRGRSLRDFDLKRRLFRYPCSYLIYSEAFDHLPQPALDLLYRRLWLVLTGQEQTKEYAALSAADRRAVLEILRETKLHLPDYFHTAPADE